MIMFRGSRLPSPNVCVLLALVGTVATWVAHADEPQNIFFHDDYNAALREAKLTKKPIFLEFRCAP
jgi:hypothetical protein